MVTKQTKDTNKTIKYWHIRDELHIVQELILKNEQIVIPSSIRSFILQKTSHPTPGTM